VQALQKEQHRGMTNNKRTLPAEEKVERKRPGRPSSVRSVVQERIFTVRGSYIEN
jgi:hypothetical protein